MIEGNPVIAPEPATRPAAPAAPFRIVRRLMPVVLFTVLLDLLISSVSLLFECLSAGHSSAERMGRARHPAGQHVRADLDRIPIEVRLRQLRGEVRAVARLQGHQHIAALVFDLADRR